MLCLVEARREMGKCGGGPPAEGYYRKGMPGGALVMRISAPCPAEMKALVRKRKPWHLTLARGGAVPNRGVPACLFPSVCASQHAFQNGGRSFCDLRVRRVKIVLFLLKCMLNIEIDIWMPSHRIFFKESFKENTVCYYSSRCIHF